MSIDLVLGRLPRSFAIGSLPEGARGYAPTRWISPGEAESLVEALVREKHFLSRSLTREEAEQRVMAQLRAKKVGITSVVGLDLAVVAINKLRGRPAGAPLLDPAPRPLPLAFSAAERRALKMLEPSTAAHVVDVISWARARGIPASLSTHAVIYTPEESARHYEEGRSGIEPGRIGWHHVGRAYHLRGPRGYLTREEYARIATHVRSLGGDWLGDRAVVTKRGPVEDVAHFEFHPGVEIGPYRKSPLASAEYRRAQARSKRYG